MILAPLSRIPCRPWALGLLVACGGPVAAWAQGVPPATVTFVEVVRANDCAITEAQAEALLPAAGLDFDDARAAAALLNRGPLFTIDGDGETLRLVADLCVADAATTLALLTAAAEAPDRVQVLSLEDRIDPDAGARLLGAIRAEGCALTEARADEVLPPLGFQPETVQDLVALMLDAGFAGLDASTGLTLSATLCAADPAGDRAVFEGALLAQAGTVPPEEVRTTPETVAVKRADRLGKPALDRIVPETLLPLAEPPFAALTDPGPCGPLSRAACGP
jgi:hypothetical protein